MDAAASAYYPGEFPGDASGDLPARERQGRIETSPDAGRIRHVRYSRGGGAVAPTHPLFLCLHGWGANEDDMADIMRYIAPYNDFVSLRAPYELPTASARSSVDSSAAAQSSVEPQSPAAAASSAAHAAVTAASAAPAADAGAASSLPYRHRQAFSWFTARQPFGDDLDREAFRAASAINDWVAANIPADRAVVPLGFAQGAALAVHLLRINPQRYRAAVALSGFIAPGGVTGTAPADDRLDQYDIPVFFAYGRNDAVIPKYELFAAAAWLEEHTWLTSKGYRTLDHAVSMEEFADLRDWLLTNDISSGLL
ncbi:alpha/beta hydrolase [Bifidobacterium jacchi]|uniref:Esterase n=1 Tax=Bifidobacterium jacchi TaxID=2490545 RepID=A0A5N5RMM1_9BIFI|nr:esterase [Bifidobacterium jacchi]KAB5608585.1 esterase [Bifidobacterium jacchi]